MGEAFHTIWVPRLPEVPDPGEILGENQPYSTITFKNKVVMTNSALSQAPDNVCE